MPKLKVLKDKPPKETLPAEEPLTAAVMAYDSGDAENSAASGSVPARPALKDIKNTLANRQRVESSKAVQQPPVASFTYKGSSPRKHRVMCNDRNTDVPSDSVYPTPNVVLPPLQSQFSSSTTTNPTPTTSAATHTTKTTTPAAAHKRPPHLLSQMNRYLNEIMDRYSVNWGGGGEDISDFAFGPSTPYMQGTRTADPFTPSYGDPSPQRSLPNLQDALEMNEDPSRFGYVDHGPTMPTYNIHAVVNELQSRVSRVENENQRFRALLYEQYEIRFGRHERLRPLASVSWYRDQPDGRSRSPSPEIDEIQQIVHGPDQDEITQNHEESKAPEPRRSQRAKKPLKVDIPDNRTVMRGDIGMPTPITGELLRKEDGSWRVPNAPNLLRSPLVPPTHSRKTNTIPSKRDIHNLDSMIPPSNVQFPLIPVTDSELIVYFFNSISRPVVALRLYSRGWGPAKITNVLNKHRDITPPYLRNTCSVKCVTAIKNGRSIWQEGEEHEKRAAFSAADDVVATDMIQLSPEEMERGFDFEIRGLCNSMKMHPEDEDAGIFTKCVQYCQKNNLDYTIKNVHELAHDLEHGLIPSLSRASTVTNGSEKGDENEQSDIESKLLEASENSSLNTRASLSDIAESRTTLIAGEDGSDEKFLDEEDRADESEDSDASI